MQILRACHRAMAPGARLWLVEQVVGAGDAYELSTRADMLMLVLLGAQGRTAAEYQTLLAEDGFAHSTVCASETPYSAV